MKTFCIEYEDENGRRWETEIEHWSRDEALASFERDHPTFTVIACSEKNNLTPREPLEDE